MLTYFELRSETLDRYNPNTTESLSTTQNSHVHINRGMSTAQFPTLYALEHEITHVHSSSAKTGLQNCPGLPDVRGCCILPSTTIREPFKCDVLIHNLFPWDTFHFLLFIILLIFVLVNNINQYLFSVYLTYWQLFPIFIHHLIH